jgi:hypothetical protein
MPGARCTRSLACKRKAHEQVTTGTSHHPTFPAQCNALSRVNAGIEASGPHDFTVRAPITRQLTGSRPSHPALNVRDDRDTSLS